MAVYLDVITGFLESGKTSFISGLIEHNCLMEYQKTVLVVCEEGMTGYEEELLKKHRIELIPVEEQTDITDEFFQKIKKEYEPDYILIEYNGTWEISILLNLKLPFTYQYRNMIFISEADKYHYYLGNMAAVLQPHIINSDVVLFNRQDRLTKKEQKELVTGVRRINPRTQVFFDKEADRGYIISRYFQPHEKYFKIGNGTKLAIILLICAVFLPNNSLMQGLLFLQKISTVFISVLIEAIPFVLFGSLVSSVIQFLIPSGWILDKFSKRKIGSFFFASFAGFLLPICDCGTVPIVSGLLRKNAPIPQVITFWLASSAVNPLVLLSVYYAFPGQPALVITRMAAGLVIAVFTGLIFQLARIETKDVVQKMSQTYVGSDLLDLKYEGKPGKLEAVIKGARYEFFRVIKYLIFGALISSVLQNVIPATWAVALGRNLPLQLMVMIGAGVFMSTCSTSNAFIGRSFSKNVTLMPIMSYIVLGPMLDIKNMLMLSGVIKKKYLALMGLIAALTGYILFYLLALYF